MSKTRQTRFITREFHKPKPNLPNNDCLFHDIVIQNIFGYLNISDLSHCRLVCKKWKDIANPIFNDRIGEVEIYFGSEFDENVPLYMEMIEKSQLEFTNFGFQNYPLTLRTIYNFFEKCGSSVTKLQLQYDATESGITNYQLRDLLLSKVPFLEELDLVEFPPHLKKLKILEYCNTKKTKRVPVPKLNLRRLKLNFQEQIHGFSEEFFVDLFNASEKLEEISVTRSNYGCQNETNTLLRSLVLAGRVENLTRLDLATVDVRSTQILASHFTVSKLKRFTFKSSNGTCWNSLETFIHSQSSNLEYLSLKLHAKYSKPNCIQMPVMKNLKFLELSVLRYNNPPVRFGPFYYATQFPRLEILKIHGKGQNRDNDFDSEQLFPVQMVACTSVKYLTLGLNLESPELLTRISIIFPHITKLMMASQKDEVLPTLWNAWPLLENLHLSLFVSTRECEAINMDEHINDSILTGIPQGMCKILARGIKEGKYNNFDQIEKFITGPSICNLKKIKRLVIHGGPWAGTFCAQQNVGGRALTEITVLALTKFPDIIDINLLTCKHKISDEVIEIVCFELSCHRTFPTERYANSRVKWLRFQKYPSQYEKSKYDISKLDYFDTL